MKRCCIVINTAATYLLTIIIVRMNTQKQFILLKEDHQLLTKALENDMQFASLNDDEKNIIRNRLDNAEKVTAEDFPNTVSRLYDTITIRNIKTRLNLQYKLFPPSEKDEWKGKISAISPLGITLMGVTKGQSITWQTGKKEKPLLGNGSN